MPSAKLLKTTIDPTRAQQSFGTDAYTPALDTKAKHACEKPVSVIVEFGNLRLEVCSCTEKPEFRTVGSRQNQGALCSA